MAPLAEEEALASMPEKQSLTLIIEDVLGELAPELEATKARKIGKKDGSSLTLSKMITKAMILMVKIKLTTNSKLRSRGRTSGNRGRGEHARGVS